MQSELERALVIGISALVAVEALWIARKRAAVWWGLLGLILLIGALAELVAPGRPVIGALPFLAGSGGTRWWVVPLGAATRRAVDPASWALAAALLWGASGARRKSRGLLIYSATIFALLRGVEVAALTGLAFTLSSGLVLAASLSALLAIAVAGVGELEPRESASSWAVGLGGLLVCCALVFGPLSRTSVTPVLVGAHYYSWFPENWVASYIGQKLVPPMRPALGEYQSDSAAVFAKHVEWAKSSGIDFFIFDWWAKRPNVRRRALQQAEWLDRNPTLKFAIHFEALDLKDAKDAVIPGEDSNVVIMTPQRADRLKRQWEYLAQHYMRRPSYLREKGAAVLFVYATRHLVGPVREAIDEARRHVKATTGVELFVVGDEVYFNALDYDARGVYLLPEGKPNWNRVLAFDAITAYNPYDESRPQHGGTEGVPRFLDDVEELYRRYLGVAAAGGIKFIPTVLPGYNDRGVRPKEDHFVIPRFFETGPSFFAQSLKRLGGCSFSRGSGFVVVTSWNEWNEGTQIEPTEVSPLTRDDISGVGQFSRGELLGGYGEQHLKELSALPALCD